LAVKKGIREDMRAHKAIDEAIGKVRREYRKASGIDKTAFDRESLKNPYHDTRILYGTGEESVKNVLVGIDIGVAELLLADRLREKGMEIDLVISHHPVGRACAELYKVMSLQPDIWKKYGVMEKVGRGLMASRAAQVGRALAPANHMRAVDAARLLKIPFMCIHTPADNCVASFLQTIFDRKNPRKLKNVVALLKQIPEYRDAVRNGAGPDILIGKENSDVGKVFVDMTGGTGGPEKVLSRLAQAGVGTVIGMHCRESAYKAAKTDFINYVIAGHIASDTLGLNLLLDAIEKHGKLNIIDCSGFRRRKRK
ncbi:MAG: NGG1p interacting factor NIF3, partial [Candidatus Omnitrophota bacterium]